MPELPEVEVVKRSLENHIVNQKLKKVKINNNKLRYKIRIDHLKKIIGYRVESISRRSKYLLFNFENNFTMLVHLGMTGKFFIKENNSLLKKTSFYYSTNSKIKKHDHVEFEFKRKKLIYNDVRRFGFIKILCTKKLLEINHLNILGPEPLSDTFDNKYFSKKIKNNKRILKNLLMDQKFISGLGNIYVNEILFLSRINPNRQVMQLKTKEIKTIINNTKIILKKSIKFGGSSIKNFNDSDGSNGSFQQNFKVYSRSGKRCMRSKCYGLVRKIVISNRSTFFL